MEDQAPTEESPTKESAAKEKTAPEAKPASEKPQTLPKDDGLISFDQFLKVDLRVAQILSAERIEKSDKLVKLQVSLGALGERQIVAGIAKHYEADNLVGRKIVVVANLKPAKLMGQVSQGMLLAASDDQGNLELVSPGEAMPAGSQVR